MGIKMTEEKEYAILVTDDGSHTVVHPTLNVSFHSRYGAVQESRHVFISSGLHYRMLQKKELKIFEMGFGTGLNALMTWLETEQHPISIHYVCIEPNPLTSATIKTLNYPGFLSHPQSASVLHILHETPAGFPVHLSEKFSFLKWETDLFRFNTSEKFDIIYYDAFAPNAQPELWTKEVFGRIKEIMYPGGCLVTYCSKGDVRRAMLAAGLKVTKLPGPPGKREMLRAINLPEP